MSTAANATTSRPRRADGIRSRETILAAAARLASVHGLDGLSFGTLADHLGVSKSGLYAHFASKEQLELETIATAEAIFAAEVVAPAQAVKPGLTRLGALAEAYLQHLERGTFPGGCFFAAAAAELDSRDDVARPRERIAGIQRGWVAALEAALDDALQAGEIAPTTDVRQVAFEVNAMLSYANGVLLLHRDRGALARARDGVVNVLSRVAA
jgi:AcrR family transcriptional regulator